MVASRIGIAPSKYKLTCRQVKYEGSADPTFHGTWENVEEIAAYNPSGDLVMQEFSASSGTNMFLCSLRAASELFPPVRSLHTKISSVSRGNGIWGKSYWSQPSVPEQSERHCHDCPLEKSTSMLTYKCHIVTPIVSKKVECPQWRFKSWCTTQVLEGTDAGKSRLESNLWALSSELSLLSRLASLDETRRVWEAVSISYSFVIRTAIGRGASPALSEHLHWKRKRNVMY